MTVADFDRVPLLFGPSPVHRLERLSEHLGGEVEIWAKREDCNSGLASGGNEVRKLEYVAAEALAQGCDTLVSIGGVQSNHTRQVAAVAAHLGSAACSSRSAGSNGRTSSTTGWGNVLLSRIMGADVRLDAAGFDIGFRKSWEDALTSVEEAGGRPYAIPAGAAGASDHPLGGLGFARWADEVAEQERALGVLFDTVVVCTREPTASPTRRRSTRSASALASKASSPIPCTRASRWQRSSTSSAPAESSPGRGPVRAPRRAARAERTQARSDPSWT